MRSVIATEFGEANPTSSGSAEAELSARGVSALFKRLSRWHHLSLEDKEALLALPSRIVDARKQQTILEASKDRDMICIVLSGFVSRYILLSGGLRQTTGYALPGELIHLHPRSSIKALSTSAILQIPDTELRDLVNNRPSIGHALSADRDADAGVMGHWLANVAKRDGSKRLGNLLCEIAWRLAPRTSGPVRFSLPATQTDLSDAIGLSAIHVSRCLKALIPLGVTCRAGAVWIADWDALVRHVGFDSSYLDPPFGCPSSSPR